MAPSYGLSLKLPKGRALWPHSSPPPPSLVAFCSFHGIPLVTIPTLGAVLTLDRSFASSWALRHVTSSFGIVFSLLLNDEFPLHQAYILLRHSTVHSLTFLSRVLPPDILRPAAVWFEDQVCLVSQRLFGFGSSPLSPSVRRQIALPIRLGGFGLRSVLSLSPLAFYASLASALPFFSSLDLAGSGAAASSLAPSDVHSVSSSHSDVGDRRDGGALSGDAPRFPLLDSLTSFLSSVPFFSRLLTYVCSSFFGLLFLVVHLLLGCSICLLINWTLLFLWITLIMFLSVRWLLVLLLVPLSAPLVLGCLVFLLLHLSLFLQLSLS